MDSFEINKIMGAVLATLLGLMLINIGANALFAPHLPEKPGYEIAVAEPEDKGGGKPAAPAEEPLAVRLASADADRGKAIFKRCMACHTVEAGGPNRVGPNLHNVIGREFAGHDGFNYSPAMQKHGGKWTPEVFDRFIHNPKQEVPGTAMVFAGINRGSDRADLLLFLNQQSDNPIELPKEAPKPEPAKGAAEDGAAGKAGADGEKPAADAEKKGAETGKPAPATEKPATTDKPAATDKPAPAQDAPANPEATKPEATKPQPAPAETPAKPAGDAGTEKPASDAPQAPDAEQTQPAAPADDTTK